MEQQLCGQEHKQKKWLIFCANTRIGSRLGTLKQLVLILKSNHPAIKDKSFVRLLFLDRMLILEVDRVCSLIIMRMLKTQLWNLKNTFKTRITSNAGIITGLIGIFYIIIRLIVKDLVVIQCIWLDYLIQV